MNPPVGKRRFFRDLGVYVVLIIVMAVVVFADGLADWIGL